MTSFFVFHGTVEGNIKGQSYDLNRSTSCQLFLSKFSDPQKCFWQIIFFAETVVLQDRCGLYLAIAGGHFWSKRGQKIRKGEI